MAMIKIEEATADQLRWFAVNVMGIDNLSSNEHAKKYCCSVSAMRATWRIVSKWLTPRRRQAAMLRSIPTRRKPQGWRQPGGSKS